MNKDYYTSRCIPNKGGNVELIIDMYYNNKRNWNSLLCNNICPDFIIKPSFSIIINIDINNNTLNYESLRQQTKGQFLKEGVLSSASATSM